MTDKDKLDLITQGLQNIISILAKSNSVQEKEEEAELPDEQEEEIIEEKPKKQRGRPKKNKVPEEVSKFLQEKKKSVDSKKNDVHTFVAVPKTERRADGKIVGQNFRMEPRKTPIEFSSKGKVDKLDKNHKYLPDERTERVNKEYAKTLVECKCDGCGNKCKVDPILAPISLGGGGREEASKFLCEACIKRK